MEDNDNASKSKRRRFLPKLFAFTGGVKRHSSPTTTTSIPSSATPPAIHPTTTTAAAAARGAAAATAAPKDTHANTRTVDDVHGPLSASPYGILNIHHQQQQPKHQQHDHPLSKDADHPHHHHNSHNTDHNHHNNKAPKKLTTTWLRRSTYFRNACDHAFDLVDTDHSGQVDEKEFYSGLLLIHLQLGMYLGPAACRPLSRDKVHAVFERMDIDDSQALDRHEFTEVMLLLFSNVLLRVLTQWSMTLMIVPMVAQQLLDAIYAVMDRIYLIATTLDDHSEWANAIELSVKWSQNYIWEHLPLQLQHFAIIISEALDKVPDAVWNSVPLTLLSTILGIVVVPYLIFKIDDFFQYLAGARPPRTAAATKAHPKTKAKRH